MKNTEDAHLLTETIYKNLATKFNPQAKLILANGKAYHKALLATSSAARSYIESLGRLGHECRTNGKGGTEEIGQAIFRIAEVYKEIQMKFEDCTKALFAEIILPLEQKLDNEFKNAAAEQRKYHQGHKEFLAPYTKALSSLEKFKKKNQNKGLYDEEKEAPYARAVMKYQEKLNEFRIQGLKLAMLEDRKCYCFILSHLTSVATVQLHYHDRGLDCLTDDLATWRQMSSQPHILPRSADNFLRLAEIQQDHKNGGMGLNYGYNVSDIGLSHKSPYRQVGQQGEYHPGIPPSEYSLPSQNSPSQTLQRRSMMPPAPPQGPQVKAIYAHVPTHESQLKFNAGETMTLVGDPADGWNYAYNPVTDEYGWLPLAYVESAPRTQQHPGPPPRAKSISDLKEHSLTALASTFTFDTANQSSNVPGTSKRPKSLHEPAMMKMINDTFQPPSSETSSLHSASTVSSQIQYPTHSTSRQAAETSVYQSLPGESMEPYTTGYSGTSGASIFSSDGQPLRQQGSYQMDMFSPPSPPLPPPPVPHYDPPPAPSGSATTPNTPLMSGRPRSHSIGTYLPHTTATPIFSIPPPPTWNAPLPPVPSMPPPQPPGSGRPGPPPVAQRTTTVTSIYSHSVGAGHPPPPPAPPPPPPSSLKNELTTMTLKRTKTDDRSGPRLN